MSSHAVASKPYWRWIRFHRKRGTFHRGKRAVAKPWNGLVLIAALIAFDQYTKAQLTTADWAWHSQPATWLIYPMIALLVTAPFLLIRRTRLAAIFTLAGTLGNMTSELRFDVIANPAQIQSGDTVVAFNAADVFLMTGLVLAGWAVVTIILALVTRRQT